MLLKQQQQQQRHQWRLAHHMLPLAMTAAAAQLCLPHPSCSSRLQLLQLLQQPLTHQQHS
jgi:hypothetical protein